jgi:hypothetical protein
MNFDHTVQSEAADQELDAHLLDIPTDENLEDPTPELCQARILDYRAESLAKPHNQEACVGATNGTLMQIGCLLAEAIKEGMVKLSLADFNRVQSALDCYLRVTRQSERYSHLELKIAETRRKAEKAKPTQQPGMQRGLPRDAARSKQRTAPARG